jgi:hypothetical protein
MVHEEGRQERHRREKQQDYEAHDPLPVGPIDTPDLTCVPDHEFGSLGMVSPPEPDKDCGQDQEHSLEEP